MNLAYNKPIERNNQRKQIMFTIQRINSLGYVAWAVIAYDNEVARFNSYFDAVDFILFMESI